MNMGFRLAASIRSNSLIPLFMLSLCILIRGPKLHPSESIESYTPQPIADSEATASTSQPDDGFAPTESDSHRTLTPRPINYTITAENRISLQNKDPCGLNITSEEKFWIAIPSWNDTTLLRAAMQSVMDQQEIGYSKIVAVVFEDLSQDMLSEEAKEMYQSLGRAAQVDFRFVREELVNAQNEKGGSAFAKWALFEYIRDRALPHEYVFVLDGDDALAESHVVSYLFDELHRTKPWFAYGRHNGEYSEQCRDIKGRSSTNPRTHYRVRHRIWRYCHPRMFQAHLLRELEAMDFKRPDGAWYQKSTERPFVFKFMELAGPHRIAYFNKKPLYNYTFTASNGLKVFDRETINNDKALNSKVAAVPIASTDIHIVACVYTRNNTETFLKRLVDSELPSNKILNIHICNNKKDRQAELESLAIKLQASQVRQSITIHQMPYNMGGFGRFELARSLMAKNYVDYVIMIDDDQYVRASTINEVHEARAPMTYKSWYGKNWDEGEESYWKPKDQTTQKKGVAEDIVTWQYGGTGVSIADAAVFQTKQLFTLDYQFRFMEDMWLSHVVHQLDGWSVGRLFVSFDSPGKEFAKETGLFTSLIRQKDVFFAKLGFMRCHLTEPN